MRDLNERNDSRLQAGGEGPLVLVADGPVRRQRPLDEIVALVIVDAAARVEDFVLEVTYPSLLDRKTPAPERTRYFAG